MWAKPADAKYIFFFAVDSSFELLVLSGDLSYQAKECQFLNYSLLKQLFIWIVKIFMGPFSRMMNLVRFSSCRCTL